jgi:hypothetical protein
VRIIKQNNMYKIQYEVRWFWQKKSNWKTLQYEDVANDGAGSSYEDYKFQSLEEAKSFLDRWMGKPSPIEVICEY